MATKFDIINEQRAFEFSFQILGTNFQLSTIELAENIHRLNISLSSVLLNSKIIKIRLNKLCDKMREL